MKIKSYIINDFCTFVSPADGVLFFNAYSASTIVSDIILVQGVYTSDTMPQFKPYTSNTQQLPHEPLRGVGNVKDRYVLIDSKWYIERKCGEMILDGSENWMTMVLSASGLEEYTAVYTPITNGKATKVTDTCVMDTYGFSTNILNTVNNNGYKGKALSIHSNGNLYLRYYTKDHPTLNNFKQYLQQNPVTIVYELAEPTYEPIDYNPLEVYSDVTHITTNSTIPCNITVKNHGYNCLLKPSTTYTISSNLGLNTVTTPSTLTEDCLRFYDTDTSDITTMRDVMVLEGDYTTGKPLPSMFSGIESAFEQEYDAEKGKYKVNVKVANEDKSKESNITFYINEPLRGVGDTRDKVYVKDNKVVVQRNCGIRAYEDGDFGTYLTDKVNTVYQLASPTYEEVEHNDTKLLIETFKNSTLFYNSNVPVTSRLYYTYSVPLVDAVAQTADISDQQDAMIIDMATQVAVMEMMLM